MNLHCIAFVYWAVALIVSGLIGWHALTIFSVEPTSTPHLWQQRLTNFAGALIGWVALWVLGLRFSGCLSGGGCATATWGGWDLFGAFIAFIGISGYLPFTVIGLIKTVFTAGQGIAQMAARFFRD